MYINIGKFTNTHGIKGEVKIQSKFKYKDKVFNTESFPIYIGKEKEVYLIESHRVHKGLNMLKFKDVSSINDIEHLKGAHVFINEDDLILDEEEFINEDLIGLDVVYLDEVICTVESIMNNGVYDLIVTDNNKYIPIIDEFIEDVYEDAVVVKNVEGII